MIHRYFILNKPRNIVSQFISSHRVPLLGDVCFHFPAGTHAIGRLDKDSEGLLLLTTDKSVTRLLFGEGAGHKRIYLVMVRNKMSDETLLQLKKGVAIKIRNGETYIAKPQALHKVDDPLQYCCSASDPREQYPHTWLLITLTEGKYHQVRKMVLAVKHRCLRLIRLKIEDFTLRGIAPGEVKELLPEDFFRCAGLHFPGSTSHINNTGVEKNPEKRAFP